MGEQTKVALITAQIKGLGLRLRASWGSMGVIFYWRRGICDG